MKKKLLIVVPLLEQRGNIKPLIQTLTNSGYTDILVVDDGTAGGTGSLSGDPDGIRVISHERSLGYGAVILSAYKFSKDFGYDYFITVDGDSGDIPGDIREISVNLDYGYDIVNCSRILENRDYEKIHEGYIECTSLIAGKLREETGLDLTDPLSGIRGYRTLSLENMELTEFSHNLLVQVWIQAVYYSLEVLEIPSVSPAGFGTEMDQYSNLPGYFTDFIDSEKYLYRKGTIN